MEAQQKDRKINSRTASGNRITNLPFPIPDCVSKKVSLPLKSALPPADFRKHTSQVEVNTRKRL